MPAIPFVIGDWYPPDTSEKTMFRVFIIGAVVAVLGSVLVAAGGGFVLGAREPWGEIAFGGEGAYNGVQSLIFLVVIFPPFLPAVALAGAGMGLVVRAICRLVWGQRSAAG